MIYGIAGHCEHVCHGWVGHGYLCCACHNGGSSRWDLYIKEFAHYSHVNVGGHMRGLIPCHLCRYWRNRDQ